MSNTKIKILNLLCIFSLCILFVLIFNGAYFHLSSLDKHMNNESILAISVEPSFSPKVDNGERKIYLSAEQYNEILNKLDQTSENNLTVSKLSDFYASLFTAIAVIMAILTFISWGNLRNKLRKSQQLINEMKVENNKQIGQMNDDIGKLTDTLNEAKNEYKNAQHEVELLRQKQTYAKWIKEKLPLEDIEISFDLDLNTEDIEEINKYYQYFIKDQEENVLVGISIAKFLMSATMDKPEEAENIYKVLETTTILPDDSIVKPLLYRFLGQYQKIKYDNLMENNIQDLNELERALQKSQHYYKMSIIFSNETEQERAKENLAVILIELGKINLQEFLKTSDTDKEIEANKHFDDANEILHNEKKKDFNAYWDQARVEFYRSKMTRNKEVEDNLQNTIDRIKTKNEGAIFIEKLRKEIKEFQAFDKAGFPGDDDVINSLEVKLRNKLLL